MAYPEPAALAAALATVDPADPTACADWRAHDLMAHLAAGAKEMADLVEEHLAGKPARPTRSYQEREAPFRALGHHELLDALVEHSHRNVEATKAFAAGRDDDTVSFTGATMTAAQLTTHARSEAAIHRWDLVGDDDASDELLAQPELTRHALSVLSSMPTLAESSRFAQPPLAARIVLRSPDQPDVLIRAGVEGERFELVDDGPATGDVIVVTDVANRLLALWGRRSSRRPVAIEADGPTRDTVAALLWPAAQPWPR